MLDGLETRLGAAVGLARTMGEITLDFFGRDGLHTDTKADGTIVTEADRAAETRGRDIIERTFPDDGLLGEEHGEIPGTTGWRWVLDPIDGTVSFAHGVPLYGVLVGLEYEQTPVGGVIHLPAMRENGVGRTRPGHGTSGTMLPHRGPRLRHEPARRCDGLHDQLRLLSRCRLRPAA